MRSNPVSHLKRDPLPLQHPPIQFVRPLGVVPTTWRRACCRRERLQRGPQSRPTAWAYCTLKATNIPIIYSNSHACKDRVWGDRMIPTKDGKGSENVTLHAVNTEPLSGTDQVLRAAPAARPHQQHARMCGFSHRKYDPIRWPAAWRCSLDHSTEERCTWIMWKFKIHAHICCGLLKPFSYLTLSKYSCHGIPFYTKDN